MEYNKKLQKILSNFDFAFKINWEREDHKQVNRFLSAITSDFAVKAKIDFYPDGNFLAFSFNEPYFKKEGVDLFRCLFKNQSMSFMENEIDGCHIFTF